MSIETSSGITSWFVACFAFFWLTFYFFDGFWRVASDLVRLVVESVTARDPGGEPGR